MSFEQIYDVMTQKIWNFDDSTLLSIQPICLWSEEAFSVPSC